MNAAQRRKADRAARRLLGARVKAFDFRTRCVRVARVGAFMVGRGLVVLHFEGDLYGRRFALQDVRPLRPVGGI